MKLADEAVWSAGYRRSPQGGRGLKRMFAEAILNGRRRSPQGGRGLKQVTYVDKDEFVKGRSPQGGRGLKHLRRRYG